jgi:phosphatidylglycerol:prolipoprotein diacylglycerol transferase
MFQDLFRIPLPFKLFGSNEIVIHGFGLMLVIGFLSAMWLAKVLARRSKIDPELFANAALLALFAGVIGARLSHVLENFSEFAAHPLEAFNIGSGGLTYYGGFLLALPVLIGYALWKRVPLRIGMDIVAPCLMVGLAFGRIGCFLNGCCYGAECDPNNVPWAVRFPYNSFAYQDQYRAGEVAPPAALTGTTETGRTVLRPRDQLSWDEKQIAAAELARPVHPAQLYSALTAFLLAAVLVAYFTLPHTPGRVFALMMILEGVARYILELLRVEPAVVHVGGYGMSLSMVLSVILVAAGIALWFVFGAMGGTTEAGEPAVDRPSASLAPA